MAFMNPPWVYPLHHLPLARRHGLALLESVERAVLGPTDPRGVWEETNGVSTLWESKYRYKYIVELLMFAA